jgi:hypothetical protein
MTIDPTWALVVLTGLGMLGGLIGVMWKFGKSVDKSLSMTEQILEAQKAQWKKLDSHTDDLKEHASRLYKVETKLEFISPRGI